MPRASTEKAVIRFAIIGILLIFGIASRYAIQQSQGRIARVQPRDTSINVADTVAFSTLLAQAKAGEPAAQAAVGQGYHYGRGVRQSNAKAIIWYKRAAENGQRAGLVGLARMAFLGRYTPRDLGEKRRLLAVLAEDGSALAQVQLAEMLTRGEGGPVDMAAAQTWLESAAGLGQADAQYQLGMRYRYQEIDPALAMAWFSKAAKQQHCAAEMEIALMFETGWGQPQNLSRANMVYGLAEYHRCPTAAAAKMRVQALMQGQ